ncbi:MAG TPA: T9SS type A sorting domain-containing protein, partial [Candidatus Kapabacteria bacterium]|nr:T9SS type A sorting domain-containing protein [Candidatus Kapabacteria bacterium]
GTESHVALSIYPNPAITACSITSSAPNEPVHLFDMLGREVLRSRTDERGAAMLNVSHLVAGIYSIVIETADGRTVIGKIAIQGR